MDRLIANASKREDLFRALAGVCSPYGELSKSQFFCRRWAPDEVVCFIDMKVKGILAGVTRAPAVLFSATTASICPRTCLRKFAVPPVLAAI